MQIVNPIPCCQQQQQQHAAPRRQLPSPALSHSPTEVHPVEVRDRFCPVPLETLSLNPDRVTSSSKISRRQCPPGHPAANFSRLTPPTDDALSIQPRCIGGCRSSIASPSLLATYEKLGSMPLHSEVYLVDKSSVLKTGPDATLQEAGALIYLFHNSGVPVPRVLDFGTDPETGHNYILMERVDGEPLDLVWDTLDEETKAVVVAQIRAIFLDLRSIRDTEVCGFVPETDGGLPLPGRYAKTGVTDNFFARPQGPFSSEGELLHVLAAHLQLRGGPASCWLERVVLPLLFNMPAHPPLMVLTHGELNAKNILVTRDGRVTALLDWSQSGFYPVYWEFVKAFFGDVEASVLIRDNVVSHILDQRYDAELAVMLLAKDIIW